MIHTVGGLIEALLILLVVLALVSYVVTRVLRGAKPRQR